MAPIVSIKTISNYFRKHWFKLNRITITFYFYKYKKIRLIIDLCFNFQIKIMTPNYFYYVLSFICYLDNCLVLLNILFFGSNCTALCIFNLLFSNFQKKTMAPNRLHEVLSSITLINLNKILKKKKPPNNLVNKISNTINITYNKILSQKILAKDQHKLNSKINHSFTDPSISECLKKRMYIKHCK